MNRIVAVLPLFLLGLACGCRGGVADHVPSRAAARDNVPVGKAQYFPTTNFSYSIFDGINVLTDEDRPAAVAPTGGTTPNAEVQRVGDGNATLSLVRVTSNDDIAKALNVDLGLKARYMSIGGEASFSLANDWKRSHDSLTFLLTSQLAYEQINKQQVTLRPEALELLSRDPIAFTAKYGTGYVKGIKYGPKLALLIEINSSKSSDTTKINAGLDVSTPAIGTVPLSVDLTSKFGFSSVVNNGEVHATIKVLAQGFSIDTATANALDSLALVSDATLDDKVMNDINTVVNRMIVSFQADFCRDAGGDGCGDAVGRPAPGAGSVVHWSSTLGVELGVYRDALNNPATVRLDGKDVDPWQAVLDAVRKVESFIRAYCALDTRIGNRLTFEVQPYLDAISQPQANARYNVSPPGRARQTPNELSDVANAAKRALSDARSRTGALIQTCWDHAASGSISDCLPDGGQRVQDSDDYRQIAQVIVDYDAESRILPLNFASQEILDPAAAFFRCGALGLKLPSDTEMEQLAPVVGYDPIVPWNAFGPHEAYGSQAGWCPPWDVDNGWIWPWNGTVKKEAWPVYRNDPGRPDANGWSCAIAGARMVLCVPLAGPFQLGELTR